MRFILPSLALILGTSAAIAQDDQPISTQAVYDCAALSDDTERLACYDNAVGRLKAAEESGEVTTISRSEVETVQREAFGFSLPSLPRLAMPRLGGGDDDGAAVTEITSGVKSIRSSKVSGLTITLENGQIWRQTDNRRVNYSKREGVDQAVVKQAAFGSFMMKLDGGVAFRVKRIQ
ncbi:hypothetical protein RYZ27_07370 [Hyphomonas sp. FCG-A18]|uniref:hypothetical protein n=1 Tax=Hyphomonas sp. FCG-A18 TaxID=3080019 RepID=UPI002B2D5756|nr:hypothetical protein RYZ27_07370 [Hyphomonas sp. FCG-A18]